MRRSWLLMLLAGFGLLGISCGDGSGDAAATKATAEDEITGEVTVFAASSLTEAFAELGERFETEHPNATVTFNFAASSALAEQVDQGGSADVVVTADEANMRKITDAGDASDPRTIARNRLAILVERGNPKGITGLDDLDTSGVVFLLCAPEVPCGRFGAAALQKAGVKAKPASLEENVKAVVSKVTLGEADAGVVYATDVKAAGEKAQGVDIDIADDPALEAVYPIALTTTGASNDAAKAWVELVLSADGQATLAKFGFLAP